MREEIKRPRLNTPATRVRDSKLADNAAPQKPKVDSIPIEPLSDNPEFASEAWEFHRKRFQEAATKRNKKLSSIFRTKEFREIDAAHEEAIRDDIDFEKRKWSKEFKEWDKDLQPVLNQMMAIRNDPTGEGLKYRILILMLPGGMRSTYASGQLTALHYMGFTGSIAGIAASSGTGFPAGYFTTGKEDGRKGTAILYTIANTKEFFDRHRLKQVLNIEPIGKAAEEGEMKMNQEKVRASSTKIRVAVNRDGSEDVEWIDPKTATHDGKPGMIETFKATANVPLFSGRGIEVNGVKYFDGGFGKTNLKKLLAEFPGTTGVLVLPGRPFNELEDLAPSFLGNLATFIPKKTGRLGMIRKFSQMSKEMIKILEEAKKMTGVEFGLLWPPDCGLTSTTMDSNKIKAALYETIRATLIRLGGKEKILEVKLWEPQVDQKGINQGN